MNRFCNFGIELGVECMRKCFKKLFALLFVFAVFFTLNYSETEAAQKKKYETWQEVAKDMNLEFQDAKNQLKWEMPMRHTNL